MSKKDFVLDNLHLDKEEQWHEDHLDEFAPVDNLEEMKSKLIQAAKQPAKVLHLEKLQKKPVSLRIDENDILLLKQNAKKQGLSYQTLIASVLHKFVHGEFIEVSEAKKILLLK